MRSIEDDCQAVADSAGAHTVTSRNALRSLKDDDDQVVEGTTEAESAPPVEQEYQDFLRQWERCLWIAPANLQAAFLAEFNADRASKLAGLLVEAVERGDLVQRAGLYFRTDQLTAWLNAADATA